MASVNLLIKPASSLCNMRCKYCFYADIAQIRRVKSYGIMSEDTIENVIKKAFAYADSYAGFAFQGGEPTLAGLEFFKKVLVLQKKYNQKHIPVYNSIQTNGYLIDDEWANFFAKNKFLVGISLDGTKQAHDSLRVDEKGEGTYNKVIFAVGLLEKYGVEFNVLCVVNNFVARHPREVYQNLKKYRFVQFIPCLDKFDGSKSVFSLTEKRYTEFLRQIFDFYYEDFMSGQYVSIRNFDNYIQILMGKPPESCAMNGCCSCYFVIEGDGSVYPCDFYVLDEWRLGNIHENTFEEMLASEKAAHFIEVSKYVNKECKTCPYYFLCRGGCRRDREPFTNGQLSLNRLCHSYQEFFGYSLDRMIRMAQIVKNKR